MQLKAEHIFSRVSPYQVVVDLKLEIQQQNGLFFTPHPRHPAQTLQIGEHEFVAQANSAIPACSKFDFLATYLGSYSRAVDHLIDRYYDLAAMPLGLPWDEVRVQLVESLMAEHDQF